MKTLIHTTGKRMMKAVACAAFFILHSSLLTSCNSFLTDEPKSQITPEEAYNSVKNLKLNALLTVYNYIGGHEQSQGLQGTDRAFTTSTHSPPTNRSCPHEAATGSTADCGRDSSSTHGRLVKHR